MASPERTEVPLSGISSGSLKQQMRNSLPGMMENQIPPKHIVVLYIPGNGYKVQLLHHFDWSAISLA